MSSIKLIRPFLVFILAAVAVLGLSRLGLMLWLQERVAATGGYGYILLQGMRFDLMTAAALIVLPVTFAPLLALSAPMQKVWLRILALYLTLCLIAMVFMEMSTPSFINQYDIRPNFLFVQYLKYPKEVASMLWEAYKLQMFAGVVVSALAGYGLYRVLGKHVSDTIEISWKQALMLVPVLFLASGMLVRSTFDHRPANPSTVAFSSDPLVNSLPLNSLYSTLYAVYLENGNNNSAQFRYGEISDARAMEVVKQSMTVDKNAFVDNNIPTLHHQNAYVPRKRPLNLVIILEESLSGEYVGAMGGNHYTPRLDEWTQKGIWFENMYATGTRSIRGIEAVVTGFTPTPSRAVVALSKSQRNFFTVAQLLDEYGYDTSFIYGGESHFDNMRGFFAGNGFKRFVDENDYENPVFYGSWGASDEDLFNKAHEVFEQYPQDKPFFSLVFTSSNHPPFQYPAGRIELADTQNIQSIPNAVKYADYALGQFLDKASKSKYWDNTLFIVVADHYDSVRGHEAVPVRCFHIPALIVGADIQPARYKAIASQIDLIPTALSLMGLSSNHPAIGRDLAKNILENIDNDPSHGRAIMQFDNNQAYMEGDRVAVLQPDKAVENFVYADETLKPVNFNDTAFNERALAHARWTVLSYQNMLYRLPEQPALQVVLHKKDAATSCNAKAC
jgi:phosphoglycerol transferase MdoB-like AlkP superfamily enzyme